MKYIHFILFLSFFLLTSCACRTSGCFTPNDGLLRETWSQQINLNPKLWIQGADRWFLTGEPYYISEYTKFRGRTDTISIMKIHAPHFTEIRSNGDYQLQIVGGQTHNSVYLIGPNAAVRNISVEVIDGVLCIQQFGRPIRKLSFPENISHSVGPTSSCDCDANLQNIAPVYKVIIRIGVKNLRRLMVNGCGDVYGRNILSDSLSIFSGSFGRILLNGRMNLRDVTQRGSGSITVLGAYTPCMSLNVIGYGNVNLYGRVGVQSINHFGRGFINIIGADTDRLTINAGGCARTSIVGCANLRKVSAAGMSKVYLYWVNSQDLSVFIKDKAEVGLAGKVNNLYLVAQGKSRFFGRYLKSENAYVRMFNYAHANVLASDRMFASGSSESSVYSFGASNRVSKNLTGNAIVVGL